jgi:hypothetical protein
MLRKTLLGLALSGALSANAAQSPVTYIDDIRVHHRGAHPMLLIVLANPVHSCGSGRHLEFYNDEVTGDIFRETLALATLAFTLEAPVTVFYDQNPATCYRGLNAHLLGIRLVR